jgi:hypothetical protein
MKKKNIPPLLSLEKTTPKSIDFKFAAHIPPLTSQTRCIIIESDFLHKFSKSPDREHLNVAMARGENKKKNQGYQFLRQRYLYTIINQPTSSSVPRLTLTLSLSPSLYLSLIHLQVNQTIE